MLARRIQPRSAGFTLIELLVVIAIIGVLVSLLMAGVMRVRNVGKEAGAKSDIRQLDANINAYKAARKVDHLPAFGGAADGKFRLRKLYPVSGGGNPTIPDQQSVEFQYLIRVFPGLTNNKILSGPNVGAIDLDPNNSVPAGAWFDMDCNQTMVFFLTGGEATQYNGFSNDATRPFDTSPASMTNRKNKFFDIPHERIQRNGAGQTQGRYVDPWGTPYVYMAPYDGKQYPPPLSAAVDVIPQSVLVGMGVANQPTGINPFRTTVTGATTKAMKEGSFQIISAGPNKLFGRGSFFVSAGVYFPYTPGVSPYTDRDPGGDDFSNFNNLKLAAQSDN